MSARESAVRPRLVLASGSPRRRELLASVGVSPQVLVTDIDETPVDGESAADLVSRLAIGKAEAAVTLLLATGETVENCLVVGSDTVVEIDGDVLGKPVDDADAAAMLSRLSGRTHRAHTGVSVVELCLDGNIRTEVVVVTTAVTMRDLSEQDIAWYLATRDHVGKAGSYAIQGFAAPFVSGIDGAYDAVVGLPLHYLDQLLTGFGWPLRLFSTVESAQPSGQTLK